ncbi:hypothetical protein ACWGB8_01870 [Kitasatospora sp. NPDC054939]
MRLAQFLRQAGTAATTLHRTPTQRAMDAARAEHDAWTRKAQLGVAYYTLLPNALLASSGKASHSSYVFDKRVNWGPHTGQLISSTGSPSWALWLQNGPLTLLPQWTHREEHQRLEDLDASHQEELQRRLEAEFPAYVELVLAAA